MINKILIITNLVLPLLAFIQCLRAIHLSKVFQTKLQTGRAKLESAGLMYLLSEDKISLQSFARIIILMIAVVNGMAATFSFDRITHNFAPYATFYIKTMAIFFHLFLFLIAQGVYMIYNQSNLSFLKKIKI